MDQSFKISRNTTVTSKTIKNRVINQACQILSRDIKKVVTGTGEANQIELVLEAEVQSGEGFVLQYCSQKLVKVISSTSRGLMYGALAISRSVLNVSDFWYFMDQELSLHSSIDWIDFSLSLPVYKTRYRGWFINDELLLDSFEDRGSNRYVWERIYETLLRLGGNLIIPGTDRNSHAHRQAAQEMGVIYTHHHAEPLGAEMFARVYPELKASYEDYPELFQSLWQRSILEQRGTSVVYNLGFRGQGDCPFWAEDPNRVWTNQEKAAVINQIVQLQYDMVHEADPEAVCSINIYGELTELFNLGLLDLPKDIIEIWADNGYGKMVSRRQGNHDPREAVLTVPNTASRPRGIYYHVAFHDLQASNFLTPLPNSPGFVANELMKVREARMDDLVLVNTGNIKPQIIFLQEVADFWRQDYQKKATKTIIKTHVQRYYSQEQEVLTQLYQGYFDAIIQYGEEEDQRAGDEFASYLLRKVIKAWLNHDLQMTQAIWLTGESQKVALNLTKREQGIFFNDLFLAIQIQYRSLKALVTVIEGYQSWSQQDLLAAFLQVFAAKEEMQTLCHSLKNNPSDKWLDFFNNDGYTNLTLSTEMLGTLLNYLRIIGDGPDQDRWEREYVMEATDSRVMLLSNTRKALPDEILAKKIRASYSQKK